MLNRRRWATRGVALLAAGGLVGKFSGILEGAMDDEKVLVVNTHDRNGGKRSVAAVAFSPDGAMLAVGGADGTIHVYDESGRLVKTWETPPGVGPFHNAVFSLNFSPDGKSLASSGGDKMVRVWDVATWKESAAFGPLEFVSRWIFFSRDGDNLIVATGGTPRTASIRLYDVAKKQDRLVYRPVDTTELRGDFQMNIMDCAISRDRATLAIGTGGGMVLWDLTAGKQALVIPGIEFRMFPGFLPDGSGLATSADGGMQIWDVPSGRRRVFLATAGFIHVAVAFTPDGKHMIVAGILHEPKRHGVLQVWDVARGQKINQVECQPDGLTCLAISPDGKTVAVAGTDGTVRLRSIKALIGKN